MCQVTLTSVPFVTSTMSTLYTDTDGCTYEYEPVASICSLRRYNIAQCARQRMYDAHNSNEDSFELWKRERISFWSTLARSIPDTFK
jgi:hypothetical protein